MMLHDIFSNHGYIILSDGTKNYIRRRLWTTAYLEQAMVMVGDGASLRAASSTYKVPVETLRRRIAKGELYHSHKL